MGIILVYCLLIVSIDERLPNSPVVREGRARTQISAFSTALGVYNLDVGELPTTAQGLQALRLDAGVQPLERSVPARRYSTRSVGKKISLPP
jgi:Type II secretion system (T2SS), protein G